MTRRLRRFFWFVLGALGTAVFVAVLYLLLQGAQTTQAIRDSQVANHELLDTITDCTQPSGDCYQRAQKRTAEAVGSINKVAIVREACGVVVSRQSSTATPQQVSREISECVTQTLARLQHDAQTAP